MKSLTLFAILAVIVGSSVSFQLEENVDEARIIGGTTASPSQFPYQVSVRSRKGTKFVHRCGGSIISNRWIVSAAQCTQGWFSKPASLVITAGAHHIQNDGQTYRLQRIVNNPTFSRLTLRGDISLLQTTTAITFGPAVRAIPIRRQVVGAGASSTLTGWGRTSLTESRPTHLQFLNVNTITNQQCRDGHTGPILKLIYNGTLCTRNINGEGLCVGDGGSPLASNDQLIGVTSWAFTCARGRPDAFTRISEFASWIQQVSGVAAV